jgi:hypothetical protein
MGWDLQINVWTVLSFLITGAVGIYAHIIKRQAVTDHELKGHKEAVTRELNGFGQRIVRLEEAGHHAPTHDDLGKIHDKLNVGNGQLNMLVGQFEALDKQIRMISAHLLERH